MDLKVAFSKAEKSNLTNYKGEQLLVHSVLIIDEDLSNDDELYIIHQWDSTFKPEWKDRDIAEATNKAQAMIKSILAMALFSCNVAHAVLPSVLMVMYSGSRS